MAVKPRHEKTVCHILENKSYETFLPLYRNQHQYGRRTREFELPLFPGYVFSRFEVNKRLPVLVTPGVIQILGSGRIPIPVAADEMGALQTAVHRKLRLQPCPFPQVADKVRIASGPLAGIEGTVVRTKDALRIVLSITLLRRSVLVEISPDCVLPDSDS